MKLLASAIARACSASADSTSIFIDFGHFRYVTNDATSIIECPILFGRFKYEKWI